VVVKTYRLQLADNLIHAAQSPINENTYYILH